MQFVDVTHGKSYTFDAAWEKFLQILPKYMNSHYYDIMSYCCGIAGFILLLLLRKRIKNLNRRIIEKKFSYDLLRREPVMLKPIIIYRICNLIIPLLAAGWSLFCFRVVAYLSERIHAKTVWLGIIPFVPIAIYTLYELFESGILGIIFSLFVIGLINRYNARYCIEFEDHHKACYAVRLVVVVFGIMGIVLQILPPFKDVKRLLKEKRKAKKLERSVLKQQEEIS